ncbi:hypothetical protein SPBRAN_510 [uncultured Candidatus Thioglobus sp.]|nr:hypothetical protein SPBRAN_510 [uncultured Candidatus Thioglobus sp.]
MNQTQHTHYLEEFGVPDFLYVATQTQKTSAIKTNLKCLVVEIENPHSFCQAGKYQVFLFKMLAAIGAEKSLVKCISIKADELPSHIEQYDAKAILLMGKGLIPSAKNHFSTHHPSDILDNDRLKREAWEVLKQMQKCLK